jgi:ArsR family transcriptional regulator
MIEAAALYRLLGDDVRLRLLRLLGRDRLNVTELTAVLGIAQSGVSRHLGLLKDADLVCEEREAGFVYYRLAVDGTSGADGPEMKLRASNRASGSSGVGPSLRLAPATHARSGQADVGPSDQRTCGRCAGPLRALLDAQFSEMAATPGAREDEARLQEILRLRKENFEAHGSSSHQLVPGRSWAAWARALGLLLPPVTVADLGCGEGYLTIEVARWARRVLAVDRSADVLRRARDLARRRRATNIIWKRGEIERVPIPDASVDVALLSQALHHAGSPAAALSEAARITVPGGRVLVLDLRAHDEAWVRTRLDDRWMGFEDDDLRGLLCGAGFERVQVRVGARRSGDPFTVLIATGVKGAGRAGRAGRAGGAGRGTR